MNFDLETYQQYQQELSGIYDLEPHKLHIFANIPSTNSKSWELLDSGAIPPLAVMALQQTAGRGQWGKTWLSSEGGLYLSVIVQPNIALNHSFHLTMATAWGVAHILRRYDFPVSIKWSNDLILHQRKLGGIKIETRSSGSLLKYGVVGIGINWINPVPKLGINLQSFCQETNLFNFNSLEQLAAVIITGILFGYQQYQELGVEKILEQYQAMLNNLGQRIRVNGQSGVIRGVTHTGELEVKLDSPNRIKDCIYLSPGQISLGYESLIDATQ